MSVADVAAQETSLQSASFVIETSAIDDLGRYELQCVARSMTPAMKDTFGRFTLQRIGLFRPDPRSAVPQLISSTLGVNVTPFPTSMDVAFQLAGVATGTQKSFHESHLSLLQLVGRLLSISEMSPRTADVVLDFPIPVFGSPPEGWQTLRDLGSQGSYAALTGYLVESGQPVLAVVALGVGFVIYLGKPSAAVLRDSFADRLQDRLGNQRRNSPTDNK